MHVAITGSMGSGKSEVIEILKSFKLPVLSADEIVSSLYETDFIKEEMVKLFGSSALTCMNEIDRKYISFRIFNNSREKERLEALIHPLVYKKLQEEGQRYPLVFSEVPLLFETSGQSYFDLSLCIVCDRQHALERLMKNRGMSQAEVEKRWAHQMPIEEKMALSSNVIENNTSKDDLKEKVIQYLHSLNYEIK